MKIFDINTKLNTSDMLTKVLSHEDVQKLLQMYYSVSNAGGKMYIKSGSVLRDMTNDILSSLPLKKEFQQFINLDTKCNMFQNI